MKTIHKIIILITLVTIGISKIYSQQVHTMYFMKNIEERNQYNPAFQPIYNVYWDLPITPNYKFEIGNNSVDFNDIIFSKKINGIDSTITFLHPEADKSDFLNSLKSTTHIGQEMTFDLIGFGFRVKKNYFTFNIRQKFSSNIYLPKDMFVLFLEGTDSINSKSFNFDKLGTNSTLYTEFSVGYSRIINDKLTLGANVKYLMGQANISTDIDKLRLNTGIDNWTISGKGKINSSVPLVNSPILPDGTIDFDNITTTPFEDADVFDLVATSNWGLGLDLGATYKLLPNLELSSSLTDIGFIRWKENVTNSSFNDDFSFSGVNIDPDSDIEDNADSIWNDFKDIFGANGSNNAYTTYLSTRFNLGGEYSIVNDKIGFGLLSSTLFTGVSAHSDLTASSNFRPYNWFSASFSYSLLDGQWSCFGAGIQIKILPFNMYIALDHIPTTFTSEYIPTHLKSFNIQTGLVMSINDPKKVGDDDKDKVKNRKDKCPDTPYGYLVDKDGCTVDTDKDGVPDNLDKCPGTPAGIFVDSVGCPLDDDKDGVNNNIDKCPNTPEGVQVDSVGCPLDGDNDGVADYLDKCPNTPANTRVDSVGCPFDSDGDGVLDINDACPGTPKEAYGTINEKGCPKDTDGDGVADYLDLCPGTPKEAFGKVDIKGCVLDTDSDGVADYMDNCPRTPGVVSNHGCPEIKAAEKKIFEKALKGIEFESGKAIIKSSSFAILNQIALIMKNNPSYQLQINGHTDNVGSSEKNQVLSEQRAEAVKDYISKKDIESSRMATEGYGDIMPIADNGTKAGRAKNRRVEFIVKFEE